jgi:hypothetical protein
MLLEQEVALGRCLYPITKIEVSSEVSRAMQKVRNEGVVAKPRGGHTPEAELPSPINGPTLHFTQDEHLAEGQATFNAGVTENNADAFDEPVTLKSKEKRYETVEDSIDPNACHICTRPLVPFTEVQCSACKKSVHRKCAVRNKCRMCTGK